MKKSVIALAVSSLALASVAQAAPQAHTFYVGANAGWSSLHDGLDQLKSPETSVKTNSATYGVFGGYQILNNGTFGLSTELAYDDFGSGKLYDTASGEVAKMENRGPSVSLKGSYQVIDGLDLYGRAGVALVRTDYKFKNDKHLGQHKNQMSPVLAAGLEYSLPSMPELAARLEYKWVNNVGKFYTDHPLDKNVMDFRPDIGSVTLGVSYRFGQVQPKVVTENFTFSSDVLFAFGKANLKGEATQALDSVVSKLNAYGSVNTVKVNGYTDRIGSEKSNDRLSKRRAGTVANYLLSKGVSQNVLSAAGYGELNPVTGNTCDKVRGRKAVIVCLAPDRRVEIQVQGVKKVTM